MDGNWHGITAVRTPYEMQLHFDGSPVHTQVRSTGGKRNPVNVDNYLPIKVGSVDQRQEPFRQFIGQVYDVRIWRKALAYEEIKAGLDGPLVGNEAGLVAYLRFSDTEGTDSSTCRNNAKPTGAVHYGLMRG